MKESPFIAADPQIAAMKQDIADRSFRIKMTGWLVTGALAALAVGALFVMPSRTAEVMLVGGGHLLVPGALLLSSAVAGMITFKETEKLNIDRQFIETRMQGGNWGRGNWQAYREEVADHGYNLGGAQAPMYSSMQPSTRPKSR